MSNPNHKVCWTAASSGDGSTDCRVATDPDPQSPSLLPVPPVDLAKLTSPPTVPLLSLPQPICCLNLKGTHLLAVGASVVLAALVVVAIILALPPRPVAKASKPETVASNSPAPVEKPYRPVVEEPPPARPIRPERTAPPPALVGPPEMPLSLPSREHRTPAPRLDEKRREEPKLADRGLDTTKPTVPEKLVVKRRRDTSEDDLRRQIEHAPEVTLYLTFTSADALRTAAAGLLGERAGKNEHETTPPRFLARADLAGLPMRMGAECKLNPDAADHLQGGSVALRAHLTQSRGTAITVPAILPGAGAAAGTDPRPDPKILHSRLRADTDRYNKWLKAEAIPVMQQMLMAENEAVREVLIDQLAGIKGPAASVALAQRALYDLHPRVRQQALDALQKRPVEEYRKILLDGFHYPWPAVADHAAEAVVALQMKHAVPDLLAKLDQPEPNAPYEKPGKGQYVREIVKINHPRNCLLCHAQSNKPDDKVRGQVPTTDQSLTPPYYGGTQGTFVRADVTYLKQDFSVPLTVKNPGAWPDVQRFDFLVRERRARPADLAAHKPADAPASQHKQALFFALRELTGSDPGPTVQDWKKHFLERTLTVKTAATGFTSAAGLAVDGAGRAFISDAGQLLKKEPAGQPAPWLKGAGSGLTLDAEGQLLAAHGKTGQLVRIDPSNREVKALTDRRFNGPSRLVLDARGGVYLSDAPGADKHATGAVYYVSAHGSVTRLPVALSHPSGVGVSADGKMLYVGSAISPEVWAYRIESAGSIGKGALFCTIQAAADTKTSVADLTVDDDGVVYVINAGTRGVELFTAAGAKAGRTRLPDVPVACTLGGPGKKTLFVLTKTTLHAIEVSRPAALHMASR